MGELANCPKCHALFVVGMKNVCENCYQEEAWALKTVRNFLKLRKNKGATLSEVAEATQVEEELLLQFIRKKQLNIIQLPNLFYPCEKCGTEIREGKLCYHCAHELRQELRVQEEINRVTWGKANKG